MRTDDAPPQTTPAAAGAKRWRWELGFLVLATAALLLARLSLIPIRYFDADELEHSHAAWSVWKGMLPYRDFFEHHTPWYYFLLAPFFRFFAVDQSFDVAMRFLWFARGFSLALTAVAVFLIYRIGRREGGHRMGLLAGLFLAGQPVVIQKTLEIRPDVPALPFFLGGLWFLLRALDEHDGAPRRSLLWFASGGACIGGGIMCTQKMLFVLPGLFTGLGLWALAGGRRGILGRILAVLAALGGVALPFGATWLAFAARGGGYQFIYNNFLLNARWKMRSDRNLNLAFRTSWPILVMGTVGLGVAAYRFVRHRPRPFGDVLLLCTFAGLGAGLLVVPAAYRQYYLMPLPIACLFAARGVAFLVDRAKPGARAWLLVLATLPLSIWPVADLVDESRQIDWQQTNRLRFVFEHTAPTDKVLDGWLGTAVFRPPPLYYFFMHGELFPMLTDRQRDAYLAALMTGKVRPALITLDPELRALGPAFVSFVQYNYATNDGLFYFLRGKLPKPAAQ